MTGVLVDTGVWIDHLHRAEPVLQSLLSEGRVVTHWVVIGELACGTIKNRESFLSSLQRLEIMEELSSSECLHFFEQNRLWGLGLGWGDIQLLASCRLNELSIWSRDKPLKRMADEIEVAWDEGQE